jgi:small subunit ribosomal protein S16
MRQPVAVKIRLKRMGKIRAPYYRVVVADSRTKRDGRAIEEIGKYHPTEDPSLIDIDSERVQYWLGVGAQPSEQVLALLTVTGDWQRFRGLPGAEGSLRTAEPKPDRQARYEAAMREAGGEPAAEATTPRSRRPRTAAKAEPDTALPTGAEADPPRPDTSTGGAAAATEQTAPAADAPAAAAEPAAAGADAGSQPA